MCVCVCGVCVCVSVFVFDMLSGSCYSRQFVGNSESERKCARLCGFVGVWVCGCVGVWVCECVGVWVWECQFCCPALATVLNLNGKDDLGNPQGKEHTRACARFCTCEGVWVGWWVLNMLYYSFYSRQLVGKSESYTMGWLRLVGSLNLQVSFAKEPYKRDDILQKRPVILRSLLIVATPYPKLG